MPLSQDLLNPIPGPNPSGENLRYQIYDKIKEARREDEDIPQGVWATELKKADYPLVIKLATEALATKTKDLQLAAWLTEALLKREGFAGLGDGLRFCHALVEGFWETLYPELEDGDAELRAAPLDWLGTRLEVAVRNAGLNKAGHDWFKYQDSRKVGFEDQAKTPDQKKAREALLKQGKVAPEDFDKSFAETPKAFYLQAEKNLDGCLATVDSLGKACDAKFGETAPSFTAFKKALEEVRHTVHAFLQKKRETEPDPVEVAAPEAATAESAGAGAAAEGGAAAETPGGILISVQASSEPADRRDVISSIAAAAAFLRKREPYSPAPYLMVRGLRWGELRAAAESSDPTKLEPPPTELRRHVKRLALDQKWKEVLEAAENAMVLPCGRAWLDLQRFVIEACVALGNEYDPIAKAIRTELRALLHDVPQLIDANLMDDTPAANAETQKWLRQLMQEPWDGASPPPPASPFVDDLPSSGWHKRFVDSYTLAKEALRAGQADKAVEIMQKEVARQQSGRGRFLRLMQLAQLCVSAGKEAIVQPLLDDLAAAIEAHKLEDWEDREMVAAALATLLKASKRIQADAKEKQKIFERICRLDPVQALSC
jgi:type VI secretion system protein ImpA